MRGFFILFLVLSTLAIHAAEKKIALLFLTINDLNHSTLWQEEIEKNPDKYNIYVHSKEKPSSKFFKKYRIKNIVPTTWSRHVIAWRMLIKEALKDENNVKFVYLSESCVPLRPLDYIYQELIKDDQTYMAFGRPWWPSNHNREVVELPVEHRWGNSEWVILNRKHAEMVAKDKKIINLISKHSSDQESHPSSLFSINGCLFSSDVTNRSRTYVNWELGANSHPYTFRTASSFDLDLLITAKEKGFLFARKLTKEFPSDVIRQIMYQQ